MKTLLIAASLMFLAGCDGPLPMTTAEADVYKACLAKGLKPRFFANGSRRDITCK